jgi:hypothetical protein
LTKLGQKPGKGKGKWKVGLKTVEDKLKPMHQE